MLLAYALLASAPSLAAPMQRSAFADAACAIAALPEKPGYSDYAAPDATARMKALETVRWTSRPGRRADEAPADWENCLIGTGFETIEFSADLRFARAYGGWQAGPLAGGWGECYYEKLGAGWQTLVCAITAVS